MATRMESVHTGEFLVSEGNNSISREQIELGPDLTLLAGTVLGRNTATNVYSPWIQPPMMGDRWPPRCSIAMSQPMPLAVKQ